MNAALNDWYEKHVGYRPQVDSPSMTDAELRELAASYKEFADELGAETDPLPEEA